MSSKNKIDQFMYDVKEILYDRFSSDKVSSIDEAYCVSAVLVGLAIGYYGNLIGDKMAAAKKLLALVSKMTGETPEVIQNKPMPDKKLN